MGFFAIGVAAIGAGAFAFHPPTWILFASFVVVPFVGTLFVFGVILTCEQAWLIARRLERAKQTEADLAVARERVRWFPALVSNHVVDLLARYDQSVLPPALTAYVSQRAGYDYKKHAEVGSSNAAFVSDEVVDRFCIVGPPGEQRRRLAELAALGVSQFNIYLMNGEEETCLDVYGSEVVPALAAG